MYKIVIEDDEGRITQVPLKWSEITIGRKEGNVIRLTERNVSRFHAKIVKDVEGISIIDLDSYNGVKINGDRIYGKASLKEGDVVQIGDYKIILRYEEERDDITQELPPSVQRRVEATLQTPLEYVEHARQEEITPVNRAPDQQYGSTAVIKTPTLRTELNREVQEIPESTARLVLFAGQLPAQEFRLNKTVMNIGRTEENDIVLDHKSISREHARIVYENNTFKIVDMKSANGVLVNGEQYARTELRNGDIVELGHLKLKFIDEKIPQVYQETAVVRMPQKGPEEKKKSDQKIEEFAYPKPVIKKRRTLPLIIGGILVLLVVIVSVVFLTHQGREIGSHREDVVYKKKMEDIERNMLAANWGEAKNQLAILANQFKDDKVVQELLSKAIMEERTKENFDKAKASLLMKNWDDAWKRFNDIPKDSYYYHLAIKEMTSLKANYIDYHLNRGIAFAKEKKKNLALSEFNLVIELDPGNEIAIREKARLTGESRGTEPQQAMVKGDESVGVQEVKREGKKEIEEADKGAPRPPARQQKAEKVAQKEAPPKQKEAIGNEPTAEDYTAEGNKLLMQNRIAEAIANYQKAIKLKPTLPTAHRSLGVAYTRIGQVDKAAKEYETYLKLQPDAPDASQVRQILDQYYKSRGQ